MFLRSTYCWMEFWRSNHTMNIIKIMIPKISTVFLHENDTVRQGLERFCVHGYTAIPVLNEEEQYVGSVTEGDFLRHIYGCRKYGLEISGALPNRQHHAQRMLSCPIHRCG